MRPGAPAVRGRQARQRQRAQRQAKVAQRDRRSTTAREQQVHDDAPEPGRDHVAAELGPQRHQKPRGHLDHADNEHQSRGRRSARGGRWRAPGTGPSL
jgi:hypothetical protein